MQVLEEIKSKMRQNKILKNCGKNFELVKGLIDEYDDLYTEIQMVKKCGHTHQRGKEIEDEILSIIEEDEDILLIQLFEGWKNLGMRACELRIESIVNKSLDNFEASTQQDTFGQNLGMCTTKYKLEDCTLKALDNKMASLQQDCDGNNMGIMAARHGCERATFKALDNYEASIQQDCLGYNIALTAFIKGMDRCVAKGLDNVEARKLRDCGNKDLIEYVVLYVPRLNMPLTQQKAEEINAHEIFLERDKEELEAVN